MGRGGSGVSRTPPSRAFESTPKTCCGFDLEFRLAAEIEQSSVAGHENVSMISFSGASAHGLYGNADSSADTIYGSSSQIHTQSGAVVEAGDLLVEATQEGISTFGFASAGSGKFGDDSSSSLNMAVPKREIEFNSDIVLLCRPDPELLIDQDSRIIEAVNVTVNGGLGQGDVITGPIISVDDITNEAGIGHARFVTNAVSGLYAPEGVVSGSGGTARARTTYDAITIANLSNKDLVINNIEPAKATVSPSVEIDSQKVTLAFNIAHDVAPTDIEIRNEGWSDIGLNGVIDNPLGTTHIINTDGSILNGADLLPGTGNAGIVRSNIITAEASGSIGTGSSRMNIELVNSFDPLAGENMPASLTADAGSNVFLDLTGRVRKPGVSDPIFEIDSIQAGGDIGLLLEAGLEDTGASGTAAGIIVTVNGSSGEYFNHFRPDSDPPQPYPLDPRIYADLSAATPFPGSTYNFKELVAGGNIAVAASHSDPADLIIHMTGITDLLGDGHIDALTNGSIELTERTGDMWIGTIMSTADDVKLTAAGSILDVDAMNGDSSYVKGNSITLSAGTGSIGTIANFLEIDSSYQAEGLVDAIAHDGAFIHEMQGDLNIGAVVSQYSDVLLVTLSGSMLDADDDGLADIQGANIDLVVSGGGIGTLSNDVEIYGAGVGQEQNTLQIDSAVPGVGRLFVDADGSVYLGEVSAALNVLEVTSEQGEVRLTVNDSAREHEDLNLIRSGQTQLGQTISYGIIAAPGAVAVWAGDDVNLPENTLIVSDTSILARGDSQATDPDTEGTTIDIRGELWAPNGILK